MRSTRKPWSDGQGKLLIVATSFSKSKSLFFFLFSHGRKSLKISHIEAN